ncbi:MAG: PilZ domain-containing protein [Nitrospinae bacterium]|nr:PilZ domain-containing protein [Nitrospinota bacterium]
MGQELSVAERRKAYRRDYSAPVRYRVAQKTAPGKYQVSPYFKGVGANFSASGAAIDIGKRIPPRTLVYMEIKFPYSSEPLLATAEVVRRADSLVMDKQAYRMGIRFLVVNEAEQSRMTSFLISGETME